MQMVTLPNVPDMSCCLFQTSLLLSEAAKLSKRPIDRDRLHFATYNSLRQRPATSAVIALVKVDRQADESGSGRPRPKRKPAARAGRPIQTLQVRKDAKRPLAAKKFRLLEGFAWWLYPVTAHAVGRHRARVL